MEVLYQDESIIVINKPSGLPVHKGTGGGESLEEYLHELNNSIPAHRLDKDTSGCLILCRTREAASKIGKLFMARRIHKTYWAIVEGTGELENEGVINIPLRKQSPLKHRWHMEAHADGQEAITHYKILHSLGNRKLLELTPRTGRTHQLRVHCKYIGYPIVGDKIYGNATYPNLCLHARYIAIPRHNLPPIEVVAGLPEHMDLRL